MTGRGAFHDRAALAFRARSSQMDEPAWLARLRADAFARFDEIGLPTSRWEEWRYTNPSRLADTPFEPAPHVPTPSREALEPLCVPVYACSLFVFVNGRFAPELSTGAARAGEVEVTPLAGGSLAGLEGRLGAGPEPKQHPFAALNTALFEDGARVRVPRGAAIANPVHLVFVSAGAEPAAMQHPRLLVEAEPGSEAVVIQDHVSLGSGRRLTNAVAEVRVGADARLDLVVLQREADDTFHLGNWTAACERDARLAVHTVTLGGALVRNDLAVTLAGEGSEARLNGLYLGTGEQVVDNHTLVDHAVPHGRSAELYKGIVAGAARGVFRGRVIVRPGAQKTDATQSNPNLLLSDRAEVDSKPQLEIWADDVKCSHGSTIGQIDPDALFYLRSRALDERRARQLLTRGFAAEITDALPSAALGELVGDRLLERLALAGVDS